MKEQIELLHYVLRQLDGATGGDSLASYEDIERKLARWPVRDANKCTPE